MRTMQASLQCTSPISLKFGTLDQVQQFGSIVYCFGVMSIKLSETVECVQN